MLSGFKNWLKRSGINYHPETIESKRLPPKEIIDSLNPLDAVIENPEYPMARIYRESFWTGITDTFDVLVGNHFDEEEHKKGGRIGILDILIFPLISRRLIAYSYNPDNNQSPRDLAYFFGNLLEIPRFVLGGLLTLALSPIVALVHLITYFKAKQLKNDVLSLSVSVTKIQPSYEKQSEAETTALKTTATLHTWMQERANQPDLRKINIYKPGSEKNPQETTYCYRIPFIKPPPIRSTFQISDNSQQNPKAVEAFKALNIGCRQQ